ncbi:hypothetical protein APSETT445_001469 [Aspergillus pseudonomiae]
MKKQRSLPAAYYRGGTSRAVFFRQEDLPRDRKSWDPIFLDVIGSPDPYGRQLDGLGGGISSLSKVCIVGKSQHPEADVDYTFVSLGVKTPDVDYSSNCGNMISAVGPFAVDSKLVQVSSDASEASVRIHNTNTGKVIRATFSVVDGEASSSGTFAIDGVASTAARIQLDFLNPAGSRTGKLLPTGNVVDTFDGVAATCIDVANPCTFVRASDLGVDGNLTPEEVEAHPDLLVRLDSIRRQAGVKMGLASTPETVPGSVPKICLVSTPPENGRAIQQKQTARDVDVLARSISVGQPHKAIPITVALALASAARVQGSTVADVASKQPGDQAGITIGHASGNLLVGADFDPTGALSAATVFRTARRLFEGRIFWKDELLIRQGDADCECQSLREQLVSLERRYEALAQQHEELLAQKEMDANPRALDDHTLVNSSLDYPDAIGTSETVVPQGPDLQRNANCAYSGRILRPTFSKSTDLEGMNKSTLSCAWNLWGDDSVPTEPPISMSILNNAAYIELVNIFFERRWPYLPVLHRPTFEAKYLTPFMTNLEADPVSNFFVYMVLAVAATEKSWVEQENRLIHRKFFDRAVQELHYVMRIDDFECAQCLLLLCMYGHNEPQAVNLWYTSGLALRLATGIDLHRRESLVGLDLCRTEMSKRVFWCAYVMDCSIAVNMGRPLGIQDTDISTPLPLQLSDDQLRDTVEPPDPEPVTIPKVTDTSTFIHIIKLRRMNAEIYKAFHPAVRSSSARDGVDALRSYYYSELNMWLVTAPRYPHTHSTFQSLEWFHIAFNHAIMSLYRPSRTAPILSADDLRICTEAAIGLISSYSSLYARNKIKYTFVAIHSLFLAALTMLYALRASPALRQDLTKPVISTNISTFLTLFRGISNGRAVGEKCSSIIERLGAAILTLFDDTEQPISAVDDEFQSWFGLQTNIFSPRDRDATFGDPVGVSPHLPDDRVDLPWTDLFIEGLDMGALTWPSYLNLLESENQRLKEQSASSANATEADHDAEPEPGPPADAPDESNTSVRNPLIGDRAWFHRYDPSTPPLFIGEAACTAFATRFRRFLTGNNALPHIPRTQYVKEEQIAEANATNVQWPSFHQARLLVKIAIRQVGSIYHLVLRKSTLEKLEEIYRTGDFDCTVNQCKFFALFAFGEAYSMRAEPLSGSRVPGTSYFARALSLGQVLPERTSITHLETLLLLVSTFFLEAATRLRWNQSLFSYYLNRRHSALVLIGTALRLGLSIGLNHNIPESQLIDPVERQHRIRIWWTIYIFDRMWGSKMGHPSQIPDDDIHLDMPSNISPAQLHEEQFTDTEYLTANVKLARIVGETIAKLYSRRKYSETFLQRVQKLLKALKSWVETLPEHLRLNDDDPGTYMKHISSLHLSFNQREQCVILTTRPTLLHLLMKLNETNSPSTNHESISQPVLTLGEACIHAARHSHTLILTKWINGSLPVFGYFHAHYLFSSALVLAMSSFLPIGSPSDLGAFESGLEVLRSMSENGNLAASEFYHNLEQVKQCLDLRKSKEPKSTSNADQQPSTAASGLGPTIPSTFPPTVSTVPPATTVPDPPLLTTAEADLISNNPGYGHAQGSNPTLPPGNLTLPTTAGGITTAMAFLEPTMQDFLAQSDFDLGLLHPVDTFMNDENLYTCHGL